MGLELSREEVVTIAEGHISESLNIGFPYQQKKTIGGGKFHEGGEFVWHIVGVQ